MDTLEKPELTALTCHIAIFLKSGIPIYKSEVLDLPGRKMRRTQAIAKHYAFHANAKNNNIKWIKSKLTYQ